MKRLLVLAAAGAVAAGTGLSSAAVAAPAQAGISHRNVHVCGAPAAGFASCDSIRHDTLVNGHAAPAASTPSATGKTPADIQSAYGIGTNGSTATVAIVDAYDDPTAANDLDVYRSTYNLPAVNAGGPKFTKVNQDGTQGSYPRKNGGWAQEISLDLDMVSAACPTCNILLVEASSASFANLGTAVNTAARLGATAISNSYGGTDSTETSAYVHPSIAVTASTGDNGYQVQSPASFSHVVAVGGTSLTGSSAAGWTETAWSGAGSGCSAKNAKPTWQTSVTQCAGKANADVSAVADPNTGVNVYDSTSYQGYVGWMVFGGTSASSPIIASTYAQAGNFGTDAAGFTWGHVSGNLYDPVTGSNGSCSPSLWCHAQTGWDGPTGLGTPRGLGAF